MLLVSLLAVCVDSLSTYFALRMGLAVEANPIVRSFMSATSITAALILRTLLVSVAVGLVFLLGKHWQQKFITVVLLLVVGFHLVQWTAYFSGLYS